jgi:hypothetical protein
MDKNSLRSFIASLRVRKKIILLIMVVVAITIIINMTIAVWLSRFHNFNVPTIGTIYTLGVEAHGGDIPANTSYVDWGVVYPGTSANRSFFVKSVSTPEITLILEPSNVTFQDSEGRNVTDPSSSYMSLTWDYDNTPLSYNEEVYVTVTLSVSSSPNFINYLVTNNVTRFSFDMHIYPSP